MLSRGFEEPTIRRKLGLSARQWDVRIAALLACNHDRKTIWAQVCTATRANLRVLAAVRQRALNATPPAYNAVIRATLAMHAITVRELSIGQSLGKHRRVTAGASKSNPNDGAPDLLGIAAGE